MNVALVNPVSATPAYTARDFVFGPTVPRLADDPRTLVEVNHVELGAELSRHGHRVTVFFGDMYIDGTEHRISERLRVVPVATHLRVPFHPGLVPVTPELVHHSALREADIIQVTEFHQPSTFFASLAATDRHAPLVVWQETFRRMRFPGSLYQRAFESLLGSRIRAAGRRFIPRTTAAAEFLRDMSVDDADITRWIPTGIDTRAYSPAKNRHGRAGGTLEQSEGGKVLLLVARLHASKGVDVAIRTLAWLVRRMPGVRLAIRGSGPELSRLQRLARDLGVERSVLFLGRLSRAEMVDLYNLADVVLCTSENDLLPFTLIEASACGRPCVAFDVGAVRDIVVDGVTGTIVPQRTVEALGGAILSLLGDEERMAVYGRQARARAERVFALPVIAGHLLEVYDGIAG